MSDIRNLRNPADKKRKEDSFFKTLRLQSKLAQQYNEAVMEKGDQQKLGITPVAPARRSIEEEQTDISFQRQQAFENLKSVTRPDVAEAIVQKYSSIDDVSTLSLINSRWKELEGLLSKQKNFTATWWDTFWKKYVDEYEATGETGIITSLKPEDITEDIGAEIRLVLPNIDKATDLPTAGEVLQKPKGFSKKKATKPRWITEGYDPTGDFGGGDVARKTLFFNELKKYQQNAVDAFVKKNIPVELDDGTTPLRDITGQDTIDDLRRLKPQIYQQAIARIVSVMVDNDTWFNENKQGFGMKTQKFQRKGNTTIMLSREGNRRIVGRGIESQPKPRYAQFGKFVVHIPSLNKGILNVKYTSMSNVLTIPQQSISADMVDFLHDVLESGSVNKNLYQKLSKEDQRLFTKIAGLADIDDGQGYKSEFREQEREEHQRFNLVKGIFLAGNNSPEVIKELQGFIRKFLTEGKISKSEGLTLLQEISCLV